MNRKIKKTVKKKRFYSILAIILFIATLLLLTRFIPKIWLVNESTSASDKTEETKNDIEYPLEIKITEQDRIFFTNFFTDYSIGITAKDVNMLDGISQKEMVEFSKAVLSEKYLSSKIIPKEDIEEAVEKYFGISDLQYDNLGDTSFYICEECKSEKIFNLTKLVHLEKDSNIYLVYADCIDKTKIHEETYNKEDVEAAYVFTFRRILVNTQKENVNHSEVNFVLTKVEKEI